MSGAVEENERHAVFSNLNDANGAARRIFNNKTGDFAPVTTAKLAKAFATRLNPGRNSWVIGLEMMTTLPTGHSLNPRRNSSSGWLGG